MKGQLVYKDGTVEPIIDVREQDTFCKVKTPSGIFRYELFYRKALNGMVFADHCFSRLDFEKMEYVCVDNIKEFQIFSQNTEKTLDNKD